MVSMKKFFEAFYENLLTGTNSRPTLGLVWSGLVWSGLVWNYYRVNTGAYCALFGIEYGIDTG